MRICSEHGFAFLCMPKCASTSIEKALNPYSNLSTHKKDTSLKHTNYRNYNKFIKPYIKNANGKDLEAVCLMREPISWLHSWYRYRSRDAIKGSNKSTQNVSFNEYCEAYLSSTPPSYVQRGSQFKFLKDNKGKPGDIKIFKYENLNKIKNYFERKTGQKIEIPTLNVSPKVDYDLDPALEQRLKEFLKVDYEIYNALS